MHPCNRCHRDTTLGYGLCAECIAADAKKADAPVTKDSGTRRAFDTGSQRDAAVDKGRYDLVTPMALRRLAGLYERGAVKYDARNWEKGQPMSVFLDCAKRHLEKHHMGYRDEDHLAAAAWNIFCMMHQEHQLKRGKLPEELDDLPCYVTDEEQLSGEGW